MEKLAKIVCFVQPRFPRQDKLNIDQRESFLLVRAVQIERRGQNCIKKRRKKK